MPISKNVRAALGVGLCFVVGGGVFGITIGVLNLLHVQTGLSAPASFPLIPVSQRHPGAIEMPILNVAAASSASAPATAPAAAPASVWSLKDQAGKVVVVNYFATWCPPCNDEEPELKAIYQEYRDKGVVFVGVGVDQDTDRDPPAPREAMLRQFATYHAMIFPILLPRPNQPLNIRNDGSVAPLPQTYVYDRQGREARWIEGAITHQELRHSLDELLAEK